VKVSLPQRDCLTAPRLTSVLEGRAPPMSGRRRMPMKPRSTDTSAEHATRRLAAKLFFALAIFAGVTAFSSFLMALEVPSLDAAINDFGHMMPKVSYDELQDRLRRFKTQTGTTVVVLTMPNIGEEEIDDFSHKAFNALPENELAHTVLLVIARREQKVSVGVGSELRALFPQPRAKQKLQGQVESYFNGMRPDLGIHAGVHYIFGVIRGDFRVDRITEAEELENASKRGAGAGAIFAVSLAPFLAFFVGMLWGVYAYSVPRETRLFIGAVLGGGTAKIVATLMAMFGSYGEGLWYFILVASISLAVFGSLTEYWMAGEWSGIPRVKDKVKRKPEDNMGI
jgi:uncharacterized protein